MSFPRFHFQHYPCNRHDPERIAYVDTMPVSQTRKKQSLNRETSILISRMNKLE